MAQLNWTYYSLSGKPYLIEIFHGEKSKHLMIFINGDIFSIKFDQKGDNSHSFFIERQLIELNIKENDGIYEYAVVPQPMPKLTVVEKTFDKHFWIPLIFLLLILNLAFFLTKQFQ